VNAFTSAIMCPINDSKTAIRGVKRCVFSWLMVCVVLVLTSGTLGAGAAASGSVPEPVKIGGVTNSYRLTDKVYSGSAPESAEAFASLQRQGVKVVLSVDGSKPDVDLAHRFGLRYVHIPIGYNGTTASNELELVRAVQVAEGPVYVHCHHGQHRGPAAAALICEGMSGWSTNLALTWLKTAGTSRDYKGLYAEVAGYRPPNPDELDRASTNFLESAEVSPLVDAMVAIDAKFDQLKRARKTGFEPAGASAAQIALLLHEDFRELRRRPDLKDRDAEFRAKLDSAEAAAAALENALGGIAATPASQRETLVGPSWEQLTKSCSSCHVKFRN
jgi:protein tyrosine phosphatase (PTP) superfamily phosphohydrolase (DUF442 family)